MEFARFCVEQLAVGFYASFVAGIFNPVSAQIRPRHTQVQRSKRQYAALDRPRSRGPYKAYGPHTARTLLGPEDQKAVCGPQSAQVHRSLGAQEGEQGRPIGPQTAHGPETAQVHRSLGAQEGEQGRSGGPKGSMRPSIGPGP